MSKQCSRVTKKTLLKSVRNCWSASDYYLINYRLYDSNNEYYYPLKFVVWVDLTDIPEGENYDDYLADSIFAMVDSFSFSNIAQAVADCNETIERYNGK